MNQPNFLQRFFILCSGANRDILLQCSTEWNRYAGIGATVFFTGLLAALSGGYALFTVFNSDENMLAYAIAFGIIWGFIIINLDRFIILSIRKESNIRKELLQAAPRFILAIIISIVVAKPIEIKLFEDRIEQQILENKINKLEEEHARIDKINNLPALQKQIDDTKNDIKNLEKDKLNDPQTQSFKSLLTEKSDALNDLDKISKTNRPKIDDLNFKIVTISINPDNRLYELDPTTGERRDLGLSEQAKREQNDLARSRNALKTEIRDAETHVKNIEGEIKRAREEHKAFIDQNISHQQTELTKTQGSKESADSSANIQKAESAKVKERSYSNNLIAQIEAMGKLEDADPTIKRTAWMIMLLFIMLETAPVVVKLLSRRGPYDEILDAIEYEHYINQQELMSKWNAKVNELLDKAREAAKLEGEVFIKVEQHRLDNELKNNQGVLDDIAQKQEHLAKLAIEKWYQEELAKAKAVA